MELVVKRFEELSVPELYEILRARAEVFVVEQECVYQDLDEKDQRAYHVFLQEDGRIRAYLRVLDPGVSFDDVAIGRVMTTERGKGYGRQVLKAGLQVARERMGANRIVIEAQTYAKAFYEAEGFVQSSEEFLEDGIPHIQMVLDWA